MNIKKLVAGAAISAAAFGSMAVPAFADLGEYLANPGRLQATEAGAQCGSGAGSGAFQYYGSHESNLGINADPLDPGADGLQTGKNNSAVCGNRQGNL